MNEVVLQEHAIELDDSEFKAGPDEVEVDQRYVIFKSLKNVINLCQYEQVERFLISHWIS